MTGLVFDELQRMRVALDRYQSDEGLPPMPDYVVEAFGALEDAFAERSPPAQPGPTAAATLTLAERVDALEERADAHQRAIVSLREVPQPTSDWWEPIQGEVIRAGRTDAQSREIMRLKLADAILSGVADVTVVETSG